MRALPGVCDVVRCDGAAADRSRIPDLLLEVAHGATDLADYERLAAQLHSELPADLQAFFCVNTDVGAPDLALAIARQFAARMPRHSAVVLRCRVPRTFVDCNRAIDPQAGRSADGMTPGLPGYVRDARDRELLLGLWQQYRDTAAAAFAEVCGAGGRALMVHSYAPRSIDVPVDERIVESLRREYQPERLAAWPLRPEVDLIARAPDGAVPASRSLLAHVQREAAAAGLQIADSHTYPLHPASLAHTFAVAHPDRTLCFEVRRDLLVGGFVPFVPLTVQPAAVERIAAPFAAALVAEFNALPAT